MNRDVESGYPVVLLEGIIERLDVVVHTCPGHACHRYYAYCIFITHFYCRLNVKSRVLVRDRDSTHFYLPQLAEFLPYHLICRAHHQVRLVIRLSLRLPAGAPSQPCCDAAQHAGLGRADAHGSRLPFRLFRRVPHVCYHVDASSAHHSHSRIFCLVDVVDAYSLVHQFCSVVVHICRYECSEIKTRLRLRESLILDHLVGDVCGSLVFGNEFRRCRLSHFL